ncbi:hypothetical protein BGZ81_004550 [Podila clonocystis]|nr:hypothetical protein BGZ81_004550 [Podila clonocystis]
MSSTKDKTAPQPSKSPRFSSSRSSYLSALAVGLLSSSCCVVQLVLNAFSIGCAGFSVLTPLRPVFLAISFGLVFYTVAKYRFSVRTLATVVITLGLTITPELVAVVNQSRGPYSISTSNLHLPLIHPLVLQWSKYTGLSLANKKATPVPVPVLVPAAVVDEAGDLKKATPPPPSMGSSVNLIKYEVSVQGMACEACASRLRQHFMRQPGVQHANVHFSEGKLYLWTSSGQGLMLSESTLQEMVHEVDAKYSARLVNVYSVASSEQ